MASINANLYEEISMIMTNHLNDLSHYFPSVKTMSNQAPENVLACAEQLAEICELSPRRASYELYRELCECHDTVKAFLETMNQPIDLNFEESQMGQVFLQSSAWRQIAERKFQLTLDEAWDLLAPAEPDHLEDLGGGEYEAHWWKPVPVMDLEMLKYTEGVLISGDAFEPKNLPGGLGLRFSLSPALAG